MSAKQTQPRTPSATSKLPGLSVGGLNTERGPSTAPPTLFSYPKIDAEAVAMAQAAASAAYNETLARYSKPESPPDSPSPPRYLFSNGASLASVKADVAIVPSFSPPNSNYSPPGPSNATSTSPTGSDPNSLLKRDTKKTSLYKTEMCRSWEESGNCRYGNKCQVCLLFAFNISVCSFLRGSSKIGPPPKVQV
jgi:hypothetical protein